MFPARYYRENINTFNKRNINIFNKSLTDCLFSLKCDVASNFCRNIVNIYIYIYIYIYIKFEYISGQKKNSFMKTSYLHENMLFTF